MIDQHNQRRLELNNALANISNTLYHIQHKPCSWDQKMKAIQEIDKLIPLIIRYMIFFNNIDNKGL